MSEESASGSREPRIAFATQVEVRFEEFGDFVTEYSNDLSLSGMFLHTNKPHPPGSSFQFEFEVEGGQRLIRGVGEVVWIREPERSQDEPPGMGIRFISLDTNGRKLVRWLIERNLSDGSAPFELSNSEASADQPTHTERHQRPPSRSASPVDSPGSSGR